MWKSIRQFFRENRAAWLVGCAAFLVLIITAWGVWGGFSFQFSRFFAAEPPPSCIPTIRSCQGADVFQHYSNCEGVVLVQCGAAGCNPGNADNTAATCNVGASPSPSATPGGTGRVDPTGNCVYRTNAEAPNGAWFCNGLSCPLNGPNDGSAPQPAVSAVTKYFHGTCGGVTVNDARTGCTGIWDMTPKSANGQEGYPPRDPAWTCTGPYTLGRSTCYNPSGMFTGAGTVTCQANTGLSGDSASVTVTGGSVVSPTPTLSMSPTPTPSISLTPTPVYPLLACAPVIQTVALKQIATVNATGGNGIYQWSLTGSGIQEGGTSTSVAVSYSVSGQKVVRVSSAGQIATCEVTVTGVAEAASMLSVLKSGLNTITGSGTGTAAISVNPNEIARFTLSITNNGTVPANALRVLDMVPPGMSYRIGSTAVNGQSASINTITNSGMALDSLDPGANVQIQWTAVADATGQLASGPQQSRPRALVQATGFADASADMSVTVYGLGFAGGTGTSGTGTAGNGTESAAGVATGPGDAVTVALILAAALTLLYSGYTRSASYRRKEAEIVSRGHDPLDFRS